MEQKIFSSMELDAIGEIMNISLGSSATAVSNMLDHRVDITTPSVSVSSVENFSIGDLEPAIGIEIKYVSGLEGSNIMLLRRHDVKVIVDILMGSETPDEEFELNDLTISAVCEVMNQMMGAASTALSNFLGYPVNISTPQSFTLDDIDGFKKERFQSSGSMLVIVRFMLSIENMLKSEFVNVMSVDLARELIKGFGMDLGDNGAQQSEPEPAPAAAPASDGAKLSQEEIERLMGGAPEPAPAPASDGAKLSQEEIERLMGGAPQPAAEPAGGGAKLSQEEIERLMGGASQPAAEPAGGGTKLSQEEIERLMGGGAAQQPAQQMPPQYQQPMQQMPPQYQQPMQQMPPQYQQPMQQMPPQYQQQMQPPTVQQYPPMFPQPEPRQISARPIELPALDVEGKLDKEQAQNLELIMSVPLEVSVEIGRTRRKVEDILAFSKGSLVVLDKLAGDQVDLFVNGLCVARGDVVVIDDNFGVRITEVLKRPELLELTRNK